MVQKHIIRPYEKDEKSTLPPEKGVVVVRTVKDGFYTEIMASGISYRSHQTSENSC